MGFNIDANTRIYVEKQALPGVKRVANLVSADMSKVFGGAAGLSDSHEKGNIIALTLGFSELSDGLDTEDIKGKREVYKYIEKDGCLYIVGSDKRGSIYGLFHLSELLGVSPLTDWLMIEPAPKKRFTVIKKQLITSHEPSVKYRGFFINDEWPAFGNWCMKRFGGINAKAYEEIFMLLLRLKGNYMWPAMWASVFPEDGPGLRSAELADELGVIMGMSHHEPCLRQGEEYKHLRGRNSVYGDAWDFRTNEKGITRFWEDGLKRGGSFENVITMGMRGEFDSAILGRDATLRDNIELLRDVLKTQNRLIRENVCEDLDRVPRMLALYKEVEPYYYGDEETEGLMNSPELDGVTLMLCDDNYGNLRTVPTEEMRKHKGGFGMYYHFDYHGYPISYEWVNSSYLPKIWEQMTAAYEFGIRELWIVNVGDIFTMEYPLSFFMDLAYDYDKWGIMNLDAPIIYTEEFVKSVFGDAVSEKISDNIMRLLMGYTRIAHRRRPEAMTCDDYHPFNYYEAGQQLYNNRTYIELTDEICKDLPENLKFPAFELIYYPAMAVLNLQRIQLLTGLNHAYAALGCGVANKYLRQVNDYLKFDEELVDVLHKSEDERWFAMGNSEHIGFRSWNDEECCYPVLHSVKPARKNRIIVTVPGYDIHTSGGDWTGKRLFMAEFLDPGKKIGLIELANAGKECEYSIETSHSCLECPIEKGVLGEEEVKLLPITFDRASYRKGTKPYITISYDGGCVYVDVLINEFSEEELAEKYESGTHLWLGSKEADKASPLQYIAIDAWDYSNIEETLEGVFLDLCDFGKTANAIKAFPVNVFFTKEDPPFVTYTFEVKRDGEYVVETYISPANAPHVDGEMYYLAACDDEKPVRVDTLPKDFKVGDSGELWAKGVLCNIRNARSYHMLKAGVHKLTFYAQTPGFVLEKIVIFEKGMEVPPSYLGPEKTYRIV